MFELTDLLVGLELEDLGDAHFSAPNMDFYAKSAGGAASAAVSDVVTGGQVLAQALVVGWAMQPGKEAKSVHAVFARAGRVSRPLEIEAVTIQDGRTTGTIVVTFAQDARAFATATVLLHVPDPDVIRHADPMPAVPGPEAPGTEREDRGAFEMAFVDGTVLATADDTAAASQPIWVRFPGAPADVTTNQALLAFVSNFQLVGVAMRPHPGLSQEQSHLTVSTGVLSHGISFHEPFDTSAWMLLDHEVPYAGRGRFFGHGRVFTGDGQLAASFVQDGMIRGLATDQVAGAAL